MGWAGGSALALRVFGHDITGLIERKKQKTGQHEQRDGRMVEIEDQDMGIADT